MYRGAVKLIDLATYIAVEKLENQGDFVPLDFLRLDLRGNPSLCDVWLPGSGPNIIIVRHSSLVWGAPIGVSPSCS